MLARLDDTKRGQLRKAMAGLKERAKTLVELKTGAAFLFAVAATATWMRRPNRLLPMAARLPCRT